VKPSRESIRIELRNYENQYTKPHNFPKIKENISLSASTGIELNVAGELPAVLAVTDEKSDHRHAGVSIGEDDADQANEVAMPGGERGDI
jgi:hypothetical protein